mgnify:CR=1 FL=1
MIKAGLADTPLKLELYTNTELRRLTSRVKALIIPLGSIEQHSSHLPVGTDYIIAYELAIRTARKLLKEGILTLVAPPIPYGVSIEWLGQGNYTISLTPQTYALILKEIVRNIVSLGFKNIILLNAHGGNRYILEVIAQELALSSNAKIIVVHWWEIISTELAKYTSQGKLLHAGEVETSLALALGIRVIDTNKYEYIDMNRMPWEGKGYSIYTKENMNIVGKAIGNPVRASKEKGELLLNAIINKLIEIIRKL